MSVTYGLLRQGRLGFVATLREGLLGSLKVKAREVSVGVIESEGQGGECWGY